MNRILTDRLSRLKPAERRIFQALSDDADFRLRARKLIAKEEGVALSAIDPEKVMEWIALILKYLPLLLMLFMQPNPNAKTATKTATKAAPAVRRRRRK